MLAESVTIKGEVVQLQRNESTHAKKRKNRNMKTQYLQNKTQ